MSDGVVARVAQRPLSESAEVPVGDSDAVMRRGVWGDSHSKVFVRPATHQNVTIINIAILKAEWMPHHEQSSH